MNAIKKREQDLTNMHKNIKKTLYDHKENLQKYFSYEFPTKHAEEITEPKQTIKKTVKIMKDMNKGQKNNMIMDRLDRKFTISEGNVQTELENLDKTMNFSNETDCCRICLGLCQKFKKFETTFGFNDKKMPELMQK